MLLPFALQYGLTVFDFWNMTIKEINQFIKSIQQREKQNRQNIYLQASLQANFVGYILNGKQIPPIQNVFPEMYQELIEQDQKRQQELALALYKEQMIDWANAVNKKQRAKQKKDGENN